MAKSYSFVVVSKGDQTVYSIGKPVRDRAAYTYALTDPMRYCYDGAEVVADCATRDEIDALVARYEAAGVTGGDIVFQGESAGPERPVPARYEAARRAIATIIGGDADAFYLDTPGCEVWAAGDGGGKGGAAGPLVFPGAAAGR